MYSVVGGDGQVYGPVDMATLTQWIAEGRIVPTTNLIDPIDGKVIQAQQAPALYGAFANAPTSAPPQGNYPPSPSTGGYPGGAGGYPNSGSYSPMGYPRPDMMGYYGPPKNKTTAILLALFLGGLGIHRFYLGHTATGIVMLVLTLTVSWFTCGLPTLIWALVDVALISSGSLREANGRPLV